MHTKTLLLHITIVPYGSEIAFGKSRADAGGSSVSSNYDSATDLVSTGYQPAAMAIIPRIHNLINNWSLYSVGVYHFKSIYYSLTLTHFSSSSRNGDLMRPFTRSLFRRCHFGSSVSNPTRALKTSSTATTQARRLFTKTAAMSGSEKLKPAARVAGSRQDVW